MNLVCAAEKCLALIHNTNIEEWLNDHSLNKAHITNMITLIQTEEIVGEKAHRWLGWVQCAIVASGHATLEDMKNINTDCP